MLRQWSGQPGPEAEGEELWGQEMERLCSSRAPVRTLPYAMVDKRVILQLREPEGVQSSCWERWRRRRRTAGRRFWEAVRQLAQGFGLWEGALYQIGGLFGTGIQSYFTFLRFLLLLNLLTLLLTASFVLLPLIWLRVPAPGPALNLTFQCPGGHQPQPGLPKFHNQLWNVLTGRAFDNTYLFYGTYRAGPESSSVYSIRLAYLLSPLACLLLCFCGTLQRMVKGLPQRLFLGQEYRTPVSAKVFSSWDFCIHGWEAATIKKHEISNEFKVELEEGRLFQLMQQQSRAQRVCHLLTYLRVNVLIGLLVVGAISAIYWATKYSQDNKEESLFVLLQYLPPGVIALVNFLGPLLFVFLVQLENYPPNTEVNLTLLWCVILKLCSLGMFSFSLGQTVLCIGRNKTSCESFGYNACDYQCWENSVGEELYKLSIFNFLLTVAFAFLVSLPRRTDGHLDGPFLLPPAAPSEQRLHLPHFLHQEVHPPEELQGIPPALPRLQLHLLLPAGSPPGPAPGRNAPGLCDQQHSLLLGLRPLLQLLGPLAGGPRAGGPPAPAGQPACPPLPGLPCLQFPPAYPTQPCADRLRLPVSGQHEGHPGAPEAAGVASQGEMAPGGGPVATAARAWPGRLSGI
ncbi:transmembrane channel-like protein 8 isoform X3 [Tamandua tetradactyla]|uniref:transmembrane channel-like protein 8 isoform X3 n=1 Tax=Tamandua tetradactyla TaxID=48850 RepID=UPI004053E3F4